MARREAWFEGQLDLDPHTLMFIDETGASTKMARLHGRAPRGEPLRASIPHGHWKTTTFTGALRLTGMTAPMVLDGPMPASGSLPTSSRCSARRVGGARSRPSSRTLTRPHLHQIDNVDVLALTPYLPALSRADV